MDHVIDWRSKAGTNPEKFFKNTLWQGDYLMLGINCLEPNQRQSVHAHTGADKIYFVLEGSGRFAVGDSEYEAGAGMLVVAPAGVSHGVVNSGNERLALMVAIAPGLK